MNCEQDSLEIIFKMPALSDAELKKRLEAHNYTVPPITGTTRSLLEKKLAQLDGECAKSKKGKFERYIILKTLIFAFLGFIV